MARVNDFSFRVATVNGTGSQSANNILFKSLFRMGIGVCGKNLFPSNIQGLPTWFQIRVSPKGYQNLREKDDIAVLMNAATAAEDLAAMGEGTTVFYNSDLLKLPDSAFKPSMIRYPIPVEELSKQISAPKLRTVLKNLFYVGAVSVLYGIDEAVLKQVISDTFKSKQAAIELNFAALEIGMQYARANFEKKDDYEFKAGNVNDGKIIIDGNSASALGCVYGGCTVVAWYPITPSSSLAESTESYFRKYRTTKDGKAKYAVVQAEDELASIGMVVGAGWAGARAMTTTSGPGISLMQEFIGLAYYSEVPAVIFDVQRVGPSTGLPTRTQQCDLQYCALSSHGDTKHPVLLPSTPKECFELSQEAFELSEGLQTPVFVLSDLDVGMNNWVDDALEYSEPKFNRGKVLSKEELDKVEKFGRYLDVDGDGICYRTLPGTHNAKGAYFNRGTGHDEYARYTESPDAYVRNMKRLLKKWETIKTKVPKPILGGDASAEMGIIAYGTSDSAVQEMLDRGDAGKFKYLRLRAYPFGPEVKKFIESCSRVFVVEQNRDGQLHQLLSIDLPEIASKIQSVVYYGGFPLSADTVEREVSVAVGN